MSALFEELASHDTDLGTLRLTRRLEPRRRIEVYEVKLGDEYLMSSLFTVAEEELARLALAEVAGDHLDVVVGGLGLGYTARTAVEDPRVASLVVVEALGEVISWHLDGLLPDAAGLGTDPRCQLVRGDCFAIARGTTAAEPGFDPGDPARRFDAILLDVDHSPTHHLHVSHADLYTAAGLGRLRGHLRPGGVFALWSDDPPDDGFLTTLAVAFDHARAEVVDFPNPITGGTSANTIYLAS